MSSATNQAFLTSESKKKSESQFWRNEFMAKKINGLSYLKIIRPVNTSNYEPKSRLNRVPSYNQEIIEDSNEQREMFLSLLYSDAIHIHAGDASTIVIANEEGYVLIFNLNEIKDDETYEIYRLLKSPATKVLKKGKETLIMLKKNGWCLNGPYFDISIAKKMLNMFDEDEDMDLKMSIEMSTEDINRLIYDLKNAFKQFRELAPKANKTIDLEMNCIDAVVEMELTGVYVNRDLLKLTNTDYLKHINPITNRIHANINQVGSATGRITTSNPNIQNVPRERQIRECFQAEKDKLLVIGDYSQIELRIVAEISGDELMLKSLKEGKDMHSLTASIVLDKDFNKVSNDERQVAKAINYGLLYGMGVESLINYAKQYKISLTKEDAIMFRSAFFRNYKGIRGWHNNAAASKARATRSLGGRERVWPATPASQVLCNSKVQSTTSDITKRALFCLIEERKFYDLNFKIINVVHDEILLETPVGTDKGAKEVLERAMVRAGRYYLKNVPVAANVVIGKDWTAK